MKPDKDTTKREWEKERERERELQGNVFNELRCKNPQ
jgi:hypothetical protein